MKRPVTHDEAFLQAIRENPADDAPRLVYADWLEDHDQADRAEFIRLQCELDPQRFEIDRPQVRDLLAREAELLERHEEEWLGPVVRACREAWSHSDPEGGYGPFFRRGVPEVAALHLECLLEHGKDLLTAHPTIRELAVFDLQGRGDELARCRLPERIATLEVADWIVPEDAQALLASRRFCRLPTVRLWYEEGMSGWLQPEEWPARMRVEVVEIGGASVGQPGEFSAELDELVGRFAASGRTLVPIRPAQGRFLLLPDQGQNLHLGRLPDGRQVLCGDTCSPTDPVVLAFFDEDGNLVDAEEAENPVCGDDEDCSAWLAKEFGFCPSLIRMREFQTHQGLGIQLLPGSPSDFAGPGELWWWLYQGKYVINWCNIPWASRRSGEITDT